MILSVENKVASQNCTSQDFINQLPDDVLSQIFHSLDLPQLAQNAAVSKRWNRLAKRSVTYQGLVAINRALDKSWTRIQQWINNTQPTDLQKFRKVCEVSDKIYGPLMRTWVEYLLQKAQSENRKLVFMGSAVIAPYHMAMELMKQEAYRQKCPSLARKGQIAVDYFSKDMIKNTTSEEGKQLFQDYVKKELDIKPGEKYTNRE